MPTGALRPGFPIRANSFARKRQPELFGAIGKEVYTREGAEIWLHGRKRSLGGRRPIDLLAEGEYEQVLYAIERLQAGAM